MRGSWVSISDAAENSIDTATVREYEVIRLVHKINLRKSSGIQNLRTRIIKDAMLAISNVICDLINNSFELGILPTSWKQAIVVPIHKAGNKEDMASEKNISQNGSIQRGREAWDGAGNKKNKQKGVMPPD